VILPAKNQRVLFFVILSLGLCLSCDTPRGIDFSLTSPEQLALDEPFDVSLALTNQEHHHQELVCIDIEGSYLEGFQLLSTQPPYLESLELFGGGISLYFDQLLDHNESIIITLTLQARRPGTYSGNIKACINSQYAMLGQPIQTTVTE
jgi:hypothetical protein